MTVRNAYHCSNFRHFAILALLLSGTFFAPTHVRSETKDITVDVDPGLTYEGNVGAGFSLVQNTATRLNIHLTSSRGTIVKSELISSSGAAWTKYNETYWVCEGIGPNDHFWCIIKCTMAYPGGPGGPGQPPIRWMSVSDVDFDADTDNNGTGHRTPSRSQTEDYNEYPGVMSTEPIGLVIPINDSNHVSWSQRDWGTPMSYDTDLADVLDAFLELRPKKGGSWNLTCPRAVPYMQDGSQTSQANKHLSINQDTILNLRLESSSSATTGYRDTAIATFSPDAPSAGYQPCDKLNYMFLGCDIDVDSDNDGYISSTNGDGTGEDFFEDHPSDSSFYSAHPEYKYGMIVGVNENDDDGNGYLDNGYVSDGDWSGHDANTIENVQRLGPGVLKGLVVSDMYKPMMDPSMSPVVRIKMISGDGAVRLFLADPVTSIGVFSGAGQSTDVIGSTSNWNRLYQLSKDIYVEGLRAGEVVLGYQVLLNGIVIHQDAVRVTVVHVNLDIARQEGNTVPQAEEETQGSITSIVGPSDNLSAFALSLPKVEFSPAGLLTDTENPNHVHLFLEKVCPTGCEGKIRVLKNGVVWMTDSESSKELSATDLSQTFFIQATYGGIVDLQLVAYRNGNPLCSDRVRVSAIPGAVPKSGRIIFVNPDATNHNSPYNDFLKNASETITDALSAAAGGDNVVVTRHYSYNYSGQITVQKSSIVLAGLGGQLIAPSNPNPYPWTTDEMDWGQRLPHLSGQDTTAIMYWPSVTNVQIAGFVFENAKAACGAACKFEESSNISILCSQFSDNQATDGGAGIMGKSMNQSQILGCRFLRNKQTNKDSTIGGGAVLLQSCNTSTIGRCRFEDNNQANYGGAGVCLYTCPDSTVLASYFTGCSGRQGGGILVKDQISQTDSKIINCVLTANVCLEGTYSDGGSGVFITDACCSVSGCTFSDNQHLHGSGGAIACCGTTTPCLAVVNISTTVFLHNHAGGAGGAIAVFGYVGGIDAVMCDPYGAIGGGHVNISECQFVENDSRWKGGALYATGVATAVTIEGPNTCFTGNRALLLNLNETRGGAIAGCALSGVYVIGTADNPIVFHDNQSEVNGGAIYHTTHGVGDYKHCVFTYNMAAGDGGAIHDTCGGDVTLTDCTIGEMGSPNRAVNGGGISVSNAEVWMVGTAVGNSILAYNMASGDGGGVRVIKPVDSSSTWYVTYGCGLQNSDFSAWKTNIYSNTSGGAGGAIYGRRDSSTEDAWLTIRLDGSLMQANYAATGINDTRADGLYFREDAATLPVSISVNNCTITQHSSAALTINGYNIPTGITDISFTNCSVTDNDVGLTTYASSFKLKNCDFDNNARGTKKTHVLIRGSDVSTSWPMNYRDSNFLANGTFFGFDIDRSDAAVNINNCNVEGFTQNTQMGVEIRNLIYGSLGGIYEINATNSFWGDATGPNDPSDDQANGGHYNPSGTGSRVTDGVNYTSWLNTRATW